MLCFFLGPVCEGKSYDTVWSLCDLKGDPYTVRVQSEQPVWLKDVRLQTGHGRQTSKKFSLVVLGWLCCFWTVWSVSAGAYKQGELRERRRATYSLGLVEYTFKKRFVKGSLGKAMVIWTMTKNELKAYIVLCMVKCFFSVMEDLGSVPEMVPSLIQ